MRAVASNVVVSGLTLTSSYQASDAVTPYSDAPGGGSWGSVSLYVKYIEASAAGQARVRVRWICQRDDIPSAIPAVGAEIDLPKDFEIVAGESYSVVSVDAPGGAASAVIFDFKEVGDVGNPGDVDVAIVEGVAL